MSKQLLLMRHAKSSHSQPGLSDFERTLNERGQQDAPRMGQRIVNYGFIPQLIVSSPAVRAKSTAILVSNIIGYKTDLIEFESDIYEASLSDLKHVIKEFPDEQDRLMLVGHNPGFTELVCDLSDTLIENLPTAGVALLTFDFNSWKNIKQHSAVLSWYDFPKNGI